MSSLSINSLNASLEDLALLSAKIPEEIEISSLIQGWTTSSSSSLSSSLLSSSSSSSTGSVSLSTTLAQTFVSLAAAILGAKRAAFGIDATLLQFAPTSQSAQTGGPLITLLQLASFAKSVGCVYADSLLKSSSTSSSAAGEAAVNLLIYLASQVQVYRLYLAKRRLKRQNQDLLLSGNTSKANSNDIAIAALLYSIARLVSVPVREVSVTGVGGGSGGESPARLLAKIKAKVEWMLTKLPGSVLPTSERSAPLLDRTLATPELLASISEIHTALRDTYAVRRAMLLQRLDVTIQSFLWSRKAEGREGEITSAISSKRKALIPAPARITPIDAFEAPVFLAQWLCQKVTGDVSSTSDGGKGIGEQKSETFSFGVQKRNALKSVRIGAVPDRGGRVDEMKAPKPEMPSWQKRGEKKKEEEGGSGNGSGGKGGGSGGGGASSGVRPSTAPSPSVRSGVSCFTCGQVGHKASECKNLKKGGQSIDNTSMVDTDVVERTVREVTHTFPQVMLSSSSEQTSRIDKSERGKEILRNAKQFEGEAGVALEEMEAEDAAGDDNDDDNDDDDNVGMDGSSDKNRNSSTQWVAPKKRKNRRRKGKGNSITTTTASSK